MASATIKLFVILIALVTVNGLNPMEKMQNLKEKTSAAIGQMKYKINDFKENTQVKIKNMKSYMNNLKYAILGKPVPYSEKSALTYGYSKPDYKFPAFAAMKKPVVSGYDYKLPEHYHDQPYSYVQFQSGPGYYKSGILH